MTILLCFYIFDDDRVRFCNLTLINLNKVNEMDEFDDFFVIYDQMWEEFNGINSLSSSRIPDRFVDDLNALYFAVSYCLCVGFGLPPAPPEPVGQLPKITNKGR